MDDKVMRAFEEAHKVLDEPEQEMRDFLLEEYPEDTRKPGGITVKEAAELWSCPETTAITRLDNLVRQGKVRKETIRMEGARANIYYRI